MNTFSRTKAYFCKKSFLSNDREIFFYLHNMRRTPLPRRSTVLKDPTQTVGRIERPPRRQFLKFLSSHVMRYIKSQKGKKTGIRTAVLKDSPPRQSAVLKDTTPRRFLKFSLSHVVRYIKSQKNVKNPTLDRPY